jgi:hypothetical protein
MQNMNESPVTPADKGFVFVVFGDKYIQEAASSAKQIRRIHDYPILLITDRPLADSKIAAEFSQVMVRPFKLEYSDKIFMRESPYTKTIFLDSDTFVQKTLDPLFDLLDHFDLALQFQSPVSHYHQPGIPVSFQEPSAGLICWKKSEAVSKFFDDWSMVYDQIQEEEGCVGAWDQRSLRKALYFRRDVRFATLPIEWQFYTYWPNVVVGSVMMVHGRGITDKILDSINHSTHCRVWLPKVGYVPHYPKATIFELVRFTIKFVIHILRICARRTLAVLKIWPLPENKRLA